MVITIIVIAILAGVAISISMNLVNRAEESEFMHEVSRIKEEIELRKADSKISEHTDSYIPADYSGIIPDKYKDILQIDEKGNLIFIGEANSQSEKWAKQAGIDTISNTERKEFFAKIKTLSDLATEYKANNVVTPTQGELCLQYIRRNRYVGTFGTFSRSLNHMGRNGRRC